MPKWILIWGISAAFLAIAASILVLFKKVNVLSKTYLVLNLPIAFQELTFAVFLIVGIYSI